MSELEMGEAALRCSAGAWPGVEASIKWDDDMVFTVAGKMFCVPCVRGLHARSLSFKVEHERFLELTERPGFIPAPWLARALGVRTGVKPGRLSDALKRIACPTERKAMDGWAGAPRHGWLLASKHHRWSMVREKLPKKPQREPAD